MSISKYNYILNSLLDEGLYLTDSDQLNTYITLYSKKKKVKRNDVVKQLMTDSSFFVEWITERAINQVMSTQKQN